MIKAPSFLVHLLAIIFGISSWVELAGLGVEMPLLVQILPEGWSLGSYIVVIQQIGNLGPLIYGLARKYVSHKVLEKPAIHVILLIAAASCLLLSFFWDRTSIVAGESHSTALLSLALCLSLVDSTSSVLYLPYMATFREIYVISCMLGEGACGLIPSIVGFIQGIEGNQECKNSTNSSDTIDETSLIPPPRFSISAYFAFLMGMVVVSWIAFMLLEKLPYIQGEKVNHYEVGRIVNNPNGSSVEFRESCTVAGSDEWIRSRECSILLIIQTMLCLVQNGVLSSIQPFSCLPYGNMTYHLSVNLSLIAIPLGCVIAYIRPSMTLRYVSFNCILTTVFAVYIFAIALMSPTPPLQDSAFGRILMVTSWVFFAMESSYIKASIAAILRRNSGNRGLFWGGAVSQLGSGIGGILMFFVVNFTKLFVAAPSC